MTNIYRFPLRIEDYQRFEIDSAYHVLSAAPARDDYLLNPERPATSRRTQGIDLWAKVQHTGIKTALAVYIVGTGNPWPVDPRTKTELTLNFIDTCVMDNGLVFHVFTGPTLNELD